MSHSVLILEESDPIKGLIITALADSEFTVHHEPEMDQFFKTAKHVHPDLIFISNSDHKQDYAVCRKLKNDANLKKIPLIVLANSRDSLDEQFFSDLNIDGYLRKPFDASALQDRIKQFIPNAFSVDAGASYDAASVIESVPIPEEVNLFDDETLKLVQDPTEEPIIEDSVIPTVDFSEEVPPEEAAPLETASDTMLDSVIEAEDGLLEEDPLIVSEISPATEEIDALEFEELELEEVVEEDELLADSREGDDTLTDEEEGLALDDDEIEALEVDREEVVPLEEGREELILEEEDSEELTVEEDHEELALQEETVMEPELELEEEIGAVHEEIDAFSDDPLTQLRKSGLEDQLVNAAEELQDESEFEEAWEDDVLSLEPELLTHKEGTELADTDDALEFEEDDVLEIAPLDSDAMHFGDDEDSDFNPNAVQVDLQEDTSSQSLDRESAKAMDSQLLTGEDVPKGRDNGDHILLEEVKEIEETESDDTLDSFLDADEEEVDLSLGEDDSLDFSSMDVSSAVEQDIPEPQQLREGLTDIRLDLNDFDEEPGIMDYDGDEQEQTLREGFTDISLDLNDFIPDIPDILAVNDLEEDDVVLREDPSYEETKIPEDLIATDNQLLMATGESQVSLKYPNDQALITLEGIDAFVQATEDTLDSKLLETEIDEGEDYVPEEEFIIDEIESPLEDSESTEDETILETDELPLTFEGELSIDAPVEMEEEPELEYEIALEEPDEESEEELSLGTTLEMEEDLEEEESELSLEMEEDLEEEESELSLEMEESSEDDLVEEESEDLLLESSLEMEEDSELEDDIVLMEEDSLDAEDDTGLGSEEDELVLEAPLEVENEPELEAEDEMVLESSLEFEQEETALELEIDEDEIALESSLEFEQEETALELETDEDEIALESSLEFEQEETALELETDEDEIALETEKSALTIEEPQPETEEEELSLAASLEIEEASEPETEEEELTLGVSLEIEEEEDVLEEEGLALEEPEELTLGVSLEIEEEEGVLEEEELALEEPEELSLEEEVDESILEETVEEEELEVPIEGSMDESIFDEPSLEESDLEESNSEGVSESDLEESTDGIHREHVFEENLETEDVESDLDTFAEMPEDLEEEMEHSSQLAQEETDAVSASGLSALEEEALAELQDLDQEMQNLEKEDYELHLENLDHSSAFDASSESELDAPEETSLESESIHDGLGEGTSESSQDNEPSDDFDEMERVSSEPMEETDLMAESESTDGFDLETSVMEEPTILEPVEEPTILEPDAQEEPTILGAEELNEPTIIDPMEGMEEPTILGSDELDEPTVVDSEGMEEPTILGSAELEEPTVVDSMDGIEEPTVLDSDEGDDVMDTSLANEITIPPITAELLLNDSDFIPFDESSSENAKASGLPGPSGELGEIFEKMIASSVQKSIEVAMPQLVDQIVKKIKDQM